MDEDNMDPTEAEVRLTALQLALEFSNRDPKASASSVLADATAFMAFLTGEDTNVRAN